MVSTKRRADGRAGELAACLAAAVGWAVLPWRGDDAGFLALQWLAGWPAGQAAPAAIRGMVMGEVWLLPLAVAPLAAAVGAVRRDQPGRWLVGSAIFGLAWLVLVGLSVGLRGWTWSLPQEVFGPLPGRGAGLGVGALVYAGAVLAQLGLGMARRGAIRGDRFACVLLAWVTGILVVFMAYPLGTLSLTALQGPRNAWAPELFWPRLSDPRIWRADGPVRTTVLLGIATATSSTLLALAFGLMTERTRMPGRRWLRTLSILPIITPPFVVGLAVILLFGRNGVVNHWLEDLLGIPPTRWVYGFAGVWFAQTLSFTPIAYLVLTGVFKSMNLALEEAAQTLRARPGHVFRTITIPLALPGLVNAFLVAFAQSLADFGNPLLLGGDMQVVATMIYFAIVGARQDHGMAAVLALILVALMLAVFLGQRAVLSGRRFTTVLGKSQSGRPIELPAAVRGAALAIAGPWAVLTVVIYGAILFGGFVENWGLDNSLTFKHYANAFGVVLGDGGLRFTGQAWGPFATTALLAAIAAPLTAGLGSCIAFLTSRRDFPGRNVMEFGSLLAGAVPGTVLGIAYVLAFNNPPIDLVQTSAILVLSFVIRNMGPGLRAGVAGFAQIDRSLEEASSTLRASGWRTVRLVLVPLLRPVLFAGFVQGFVSAMTTVSAVIFLVSPGLTLLTVYIVNLAEAGTYGMAIAASSVLLLAMLAVIVGVDLLFGDRPALRKSTPLEARSATR